MKEQRQEYFGKDCKKTFKGFSLDSRGDVIGAFPSVDVIQEQRERLINTVADARGKTMTIEEYEKNKKEYAEKCLSKGYYLYIYYSTEGYYKFKPVDPNYVDIEKFKEKYAHKKTLYSSYEEVRKELDSLNKNVCDYNLKMKARVSSINACKETTWISQPSYEEGYIAGTIENGIVWHDLRKDPKDLPKDRHNVIVALTNGYSEQDNYYEFRWGCNSNRDVIAWSEIPKFTEN